MKTIVEMNYKGFVIRVVKTDEVMDGIDYWKYNYVAEQWIYRKEIDMEELGVCFYGKNMLEAVKELRVWIDMIDKNRTRFKEKYGYDLED
ncbi:hypothetical protein CAL7716_057410 [Calothrix sp. PCC 7716]|nr:hypothetical protein CAL7716_057410 [Calothrix sp. PCC 7716]